MPGRSPIIRPASFADKGIVRQLLEFNAYEFSRLDGADLDGHGRFGYAYLDLYWTEPDRHPYLILVGASIAGMALVRAGPPHSVAEFLIMPKYRRARIGTAGARDLLSRHPGHLEVRQNQGNESAVAFWRHAIVRVHRAARRARHNADLHDRHPSPASVCQLNRLFCYVSRRAEQYGFVPN